MRTRLRDRFARAASRVVGRDRELALIAQQLSPDGAVVTFVHGIGGIGKSSLLDAVAPQLSDLGARVIRLDGRSIEPTARGFLAALADALDLDALFDVEAAADAIDRDAAPTVIMVDEFDPIRLLDAWLRHTLIPAMPERTRFVLAGRFAPRSPWLTTPGWSDAIISLRLGTLDEASAKSLLARHGVEERAMSRMIEVARGTPLALELVARTSDEAVGGVNEAAVLEALAQRCVDDLDPRLRAAVEASCVVRRATRPLLDAMVDCDDALLSSLGELPFVERADDGLAIHDVVRQAVLSRMRALDPDRYRVLRLAAWSVLERMLAAGKPTGPDAWRLTADVLFVVESLEVREAFFPSHEESLSVDRALPSDGDALVSMIQRREPTELAAILTRWWNDAPSTFSVARDATGRVVAFSIVARADEVPPSLAAHDPLLRAWLGDVAQGSLKDRGALFIRALTHDVDALVSEARAALWLDAKRAYIEHPTNWAVYAATQHVDTMFAVVERLGFRRSNLRAGGEDTLILEFGADGIWTWLRRLVGAPVDRAGGARLDDSARALLVDGEEVALTPLEYAFLAHLVAARGAVVTRDELLDRVWKDRNTGSNVVDALVRLLRKKLGPHAPDLETIKGHGYRFNAARKRADTL